MIVGLFSSKTKTIVGTTVSRVISDELIPDAIKVGVTTSLLKSSDMVEEVLEQVIDSIGIRAERMYRYGKNHYVHGLPSGNFLSSNLGLSEVTQVLNTIEGSLVTVHYSHFAQPNILHIGWMRLISNFGYVQTTNEIVGLSIVFGYPVYLEDLTVKLPSATASTYTDEALQQWGTPASAGYTPVRLSAATIGYLSGVKPVETDALAVNPYVKVDYSYVIPAGTIINEVATLLPETVTGTLSITVEGFNEHVDHFHVKYTVGGVIKYWMYQSGLGTYPTLDAVFNQPPAINGTFFPVTYFRHNKVSEISNTTTPEYLTSKKLCKYIGIDFDTLSEDINSNPDIADVQQAMMVFAVPASSTNQIELRYLHKFFSVMFDSDLNKFSSLNLLNIHNVLNSDNSTSDSQSTVSSLVIQDTRFKVVLRQSGIVKQALIMNIGPVGTYSMLVDETTPDTPVHIYRKQLTDLICEEIRVVKLEMVYYILGSYTVTADDVDTILLIPLDMSITSTFTVLEREELYARSLHFVFNSAVVVKIKWYQSGFFKILLTVAAIAITLLSAVSDGGALLAALLSGGAAATAAIKVIIIKILVGLAIQFALKLFVKVVGIKIAFIVALAVALYSAKVALAKEVVKGAPTALEYLELSTGLFNAASEELESQFIDLDREFKAFEEYKDAADERLKAGNDLLGSSIRLDPFIIFGETPDEYYNRTTHSGNIGVLSLDAISNYVDISLTLPKINSTLGESIHDQ